MGEHTRTRRRRRDADNIRVSVASGVAELVPDRFRARAMTLLLDGTAQSYVDLDDPTYLSFEYMRRIGHVLDLAAPPGLPLRVLHLGGGAWTLPRYVAATRPRSSQQVVEIDAELVEMVRHYLPLPRGSGIRVRVGDARQMASQYPDARFDVVVSDVFAGARTPAHVTSVEFMTEIARILRPDGVYTANLADGSGLAFARSQVATVRAVFDQVCVLADGGVLKGRRFGNVVLVASRRALPIEELARRLAGDIFPGRVVAGQALTDFTAGARPVLDTHAVASPPPPPTVYIGGW